ncbi:glycoside hydrolase family 5 protein [Pantoea sp. ME81]|uniref:glycoside hydrolase family 5 protein n=1 Tax=Pantoea sp. ME81 TaxID=2743935 RepID=UPI0021073E22|nr:cellulase family glycosylhydrolase [Pantoea sp. ME81]
MRQIIQTFTLLLLISFTIPVVRAADKMDFWLQPQHGGNSFNRIPPNTAYFNALHTYGASWVRLSWDKWPTQQRDFLLGSADRYQGLVAEDVATLRNVLDNAEAAGLKVVITPLSLPGMRWSQNNGGQFDDRLWQDNAFWQQSARYWRDLAAALQDHPAVAAYNIINEPAPEKMGGLDEHASAATMKSWYLQQKGTARDLPGFYRTVIAAIREVDQQTPVMVDSGWYAAADAFTYWPQPLEDKRVLYSVHMYEPYSATSAPNAKRKAPWPYPGKVPFAGLQQQWDAQRVAEYLALPFEWAKSHGVARHQMVVGEFGCVRTLPGCTQYLEDVLKVLDQQQSHWAFYSFREDSWDGMDYELGDKKVPWQYWQAAEQNLPDTVPRHATKEFEPIRKRLER